MYDITSNILCAVLKHQCVSKYGQALVTTTVL